MQSFDAHVHLVHFHTLVQVDNQPSDSGKDTKIVDYEPHRPATQQRITSKRIEGPNIRVKKRVEKDMQVYT